MKVMRRSVVSLFVALMMLGVCSLPASLAQEASPASSLSDLGLPELDIAVSPATIEGVPDTLEAGRYVLNVTASDELEFGGGLEFIQPGSMSAEEFMSVMVGQVEADGAELATPDGTEDAASPVSEEEMGAPPAVLWDSVYAGGVYAPSGSTAHAIVDLRPGEWVVFGGFDNPQQPFTIEVTGEFPADVAEPVSSATITLGEYSIQITEGELVAGRQLVRIDNTGAQPHFVLAGFTEVDVTKDDISAVLESEMTGTPAAVDFDPEADFEDAFYTGNLSTGSTMWMEVDLKPGNYILLCYFPDIADGMPHALHGMLEVVKIEG